MFGQAERKDAPNWENGCILKRKNESNAPIAAHSTIGFRYPARGSCVRMISSGAVWCGVQSVNIRPTQAIAMTLHSKPENKIESSL